MPHSTPPAPFSRTLAAWGSEVFGAVLQAEFQQLPADALPLHRAMSLGSHVAEGEHSAMIISSTDSGDTLDIKLGVFFGSVIAGCQCADDPSPVEVMNEYCEMRLLIEKADGAYSVRLLSEQE